MHTKSARGQSVLIMGLVLLAGMNLWGDSSYQVQMRGHNAKQQAALHLTLTETA